MAIESSAVNQLVNLMGGKPLAQEPGDDLLFRMPRPGSKSAKPKPVRSHAAPRLPLTPLPLTPLPPLRAKPVGTAPPPPRLVAAPIPMAPNVASPTLASRYNAAARSTIAAAKPTHKNDETRPVFRGNPLVRKLTVVIVLTALAGLSMLGYLVFMSSNRASIAATTPAPIAAPAPMALTAQPAAMPAPAPVAKLAVPVVVKAPPVNAVAIRFDSTPPGANVTLVHSSGTSFVGTTPIEASVDPSRTYDVVFALEGRPTKIAVLDPRTQQRLAIELDTVAPAAPVVAPVVAAVASDVAPVAHRHAKHPARPTKAAKQVATATPAPTGMGVLMVSSKPPCTIVVDGKPTQLMTPQRSIALSAGSHKVTLINAQQKIKKTFPVQIKAQRSTKLIQDFLKTAARRSSLR